MLRSTYTYALMEVSPSTYDEVRANLVAAQYQHAIHDRKSEPHEALDMHGIALVKKPELVVAPADAPLGGPNKSSVFVLAGADGKMLVDVRTDGSVAFGSGFSPDTAARLMFECFAQYFKPTGLPAPVEKCSCRTGCKSPTCTNC
jgi:hypothetical protein